MALDVDLRTTGIGFLAALVVLAVVVTLVGIGDTIAALAQADPPTVGLMLLVALGWLVAWGLALRTVLGVIGPALTPSTAVLVFAGATFANNVTPFGQAGGEPVSALLISRVTNSNYETGLAAIASVDALNFVPSVTLGLVGLGYLGATAVLGRRLRIAAVVVAVMALAIVVGGYLGWRHRYEVEAAVVRALTPVFRLGGRIHPRRRPPSSRVVERRIEAFFLAVDRVAADRQSLVLALGFSALGWLCLVTSLWLALLALGYRVPFPIVLAVIPIGGLASVTPLPGGLGGVEAVLIGLLPTATGITPSVAAAAVLVHRSGTYWLPTVVGAGAGAALGTR